MSGPPDEPPRPASGWVAGPLAALGWAGLLVIPGWFAGLLASEGRRFGWVALGFVLLSPALTAGLVVGTNPRSPAWPRAGRPGFGLYDVLLIGAGLLAGVVPATVAGVFVGQQVAAGLGWLVFLVSALLAVVAAGVMAWRTRDRRDWHPWLIGLGLLGLVTFAAAVFFAFRNAEAAANAPDAEKLAGLGDTLIGLACVPVADAGLLVAVAGAWGRWVLTGRPRDRGGAG